MTDETTRAAGEAGGIAPDALRDETGHVSASWLDGLRDALRASDIERLSALMEPLHSADAGDVIEALEQEERLALVTLLGDAFDYSALTEVDDAVRAELIEAIPNAAIARGVAELDSDDAVFILEDIEPGDREDILNQLPAFERLSLKRSLDYPEESAGRRMQTDFIAIPPFWTVGQTIDYLRADKDLPDEFYQIYVVDPGYRLLGTLSLDRFLRSKRNIRIADIMNADPLTVPAASDQEEAARTFERYDLVEVGVVDDAVRLVGVLTIDDIVDVIQEEATEDIQRMAGVGDEEISDSVFGALKSRLVWLCVNLVTAILASLVIGLFNATIEQMVALAALMPIVASMGGNAATQTMTVTVRALAMHELDRRKVMRLISREMIVGVVNGAVFAVLVGIVTMLRYGNPGLGAVIAMAMIINMFVAGSAGVLIPLLLNRLKADPAVASGTFVTTLTDVIGFFAFLSIAGLWFDLF
ncbi:MAG: magnesium transporter [Devosia sp.]